MRASRVAGELSGWACGATYRLMTDALPVPPRCGIRFADMPQVSFPEEVQKLLSGSDYEGPVATLSTVAHAVLTDNSMPFFPGYTGHGVDHVEGVLRTAVMLIPSSVFEIGFLRPADAAALTCATILHDLAMHLRERGFAELVSPVTPFEPLPFFAEPHDDRPIDRPWPELWTEFQREARHFGPGHLDTILGRAHRGVPLVAFAEDIDPEALDSYDKLLIGEFLRRHHALGEMAMSIRCAVAIPAVAEKLNSDFSRASAWLRAPSVAILSSHRRTHGVLICAIGVGPSCRPKW